jgi:hypothetical protein
VIFEVIAVQPAGLVNNSPSPFLKHVPQKRKKKNFYYKGKTFREIMVKKMLEDGHLPNAL